MSPPLKHNHSSLEATSITGENSEETIHIRSVEQMVADLEECKKYNKQLKKTKTAMMKLAHKKMKEQSVVIKSLQDKLEKYDEQWYQTCTEIENLKSTRF